MAEPLAEPDYIATQAQLLAFAGAILDLPLEAFLATISEAETWGPIDDPTLFRKASPNLAAVRKLAEGALKFKRACVAVKETVLPRQEPDHG